MSHTQPAPVSFGIATAPQQVSYHDVLRVWSEADTIPEIEHAWLFDHLLPIGGDPNGPIFEGWTLLSALAAQTRRLRLGLLVTSNRFRPPAMLAKIATTVDIVSGGRLDFGIGVGSRPNPPAARREYPAHGLPYLDFADAVASLAEACTIIRRLWTDDEPFDYDGQYYQFADFVSDVFPVQQPRPKVSFGGSSAAAYAAGGAEADIYCLWGEPLARTAEQIESVKAAARAAGRADVPKIQVAFRPIIAPTEEQAWEKAHSIVARIEARVAASGGRLSRRRPVKNPENTGSQRLIAIAAEGERFDRALWTRTAAVTGGAGNSNALVGTPETVAQAILDYIDLGVDIISMRGYDLLTDAIDIGQQVIPIVREEVAKRDAREKTLA